MKIYIFGFVFIARRAAMTPEDLKNVNDMVRVAMTPEDLQNINDMVFMHTGLTLSEYMDRLNNPRNLTTVAPSEDAIRAKEYGFLF